MSAFGTVLIKAPAKAASAVPLTTLDKREMKSPEPISPESAAATAANRKAWDHWASLHPATKFYDSAKFRETKNSLNPEELRLLGDISGKKILHLQCHFGQDTLSLAHLGATVTGVDLSKTAIETARALSSELKVPASFVESDVLTLNLDKKFDIVFTSYGVLTWLSDLKKWAEVIANHLVPGGKLVVMEFHPLVHITNDDFTGFSRDYPYSSGGKPVICPGQKSYADLTDTVEHTVHEFGHNLGDILEATRLANIGDCILQEYDYSNYCCFPGLTEREPGKFVHPVYSGPLMFSLEATFRPTYRLEMQLLAQEERIKGLQAEIARLSGPPLAASASVAATPAP